MTKEEGFEIFKQMGFEPTIKEEEIVFKKRLLGDLNVYLEDDTYSIQFIHHTRPNTSVDDLENEFAKLAHQIIAIKGLCNCIYGRKKEEVEENV